MTFRLVDLVEDILWNGDDDPHQLHSAFKQPMSDAAGLSRSDTDTLTGHPASAGCWGLKFRC